MNGYPLYHYARQKIALPKPIETRSCTIYNLELVNFQEGKQHSWPEPKVELSEDEKETMRQLETMVQESTNASDVARPDKAAAEKHDVGNGKLAELSNIDQTAINSGTEGVFTKWC